MKRAKREIERDKYTQKSAFFVQDARKLATHILFRFYLKHEAIPFHLRYSSHSRVDFVFSLSFSVYFMFVNIKYLAKLKRKMRHCWNKRTAK